MAEHDKLVPADNHVAATGVGVGHRIEAGLGQDRVTAMFQDVIVGFDKDVDSARGYIIACPPRWAEVDAEGENGGPSCGWPFDVPRATVQQTRANLCIRGELALRYVQRAGTRPSLRNQAL